jgi:O104-antigen biosynthesis beta-1,3-galactosyltransferase
MNLSVLMSVYSNDDPQHLAVALQSMCDQTLPASEVILVEDGPLGGPLHEVIEEYSTRLPLAIVKLPNNSGLGEALRIGMTRCSNELVARMDSDDICVPSRFEKQLKFLRTHTEIDVVGSAIAEFDDDSTVIHAVRCLPLEGEDLISFAKRRNPLNHMTVMFRKKKVLLAGGYEHVRGFEDYHLWARMLMIGSKLSNLEEPLVLVRCGNGMQSRRGGMAYANQELRLQLYFHKIGFLSAAEAIRNTFVRAPVRLIPASMRGLLYTRLLRSTAERHLVSCDRQGQKVELGSPH